MKNTIIRTDFDFAQQTNVYHGKVRDVYTINDELLVMIASDRISAFDIVLPKGIPFKGQVLNQIASKFLDMTEDIVPNWKIATPDPMVTVGRKCKPFKIEMVIRRYLTGHAWREYKNGKRSLCGITLDEKMKEHQKFDRAIITPTTKEYIGHDENISKEDILKLGLVSKEHYAKLEEYTYALFERGTQIANKMGLILVDTKYEFGLNNGKIYLIDEIHTPDSSRYFYKKSYKEAFDNDLPQKQLSKEFVREWLMQNDFQGKEKQTIPNMTEEFVTNVSNRYIELYEHITGDSFEKADVSDVLKRLEKNVSGFLEAYYR